MDLNRVQHPGQHEAAVFLPDLCGLTALFVVAVVSELVAVIVVIGGHGFGVGFVDELALMSLYTQLLGLSAAAVLCLARKPLNGLNEWTIATLSYVIILAVTYLVAETAWWVINPLVGEGALISVARPEFILRTVAISAVVAALVLRYFYVQFHWKHRIASEAQARLEALQARIRPHFFFNCMNSIASLTRSDPALAERAVEDLADLFRASFADAQALVPFAEELDFVERYLNIERLRLGERLRVELDIQPLPASARLPLLSLQPIVENAIYHGIEPASGGGTVKISAHADRHQLFIEVVNPAADDGNRHHQGNRIALENVRQRLRAHFGERAKLEAEREAGVYRVRLHLPLGEQHST